MPTLVRPIEGFPYCPPDSFAGQGITLAGLNEIISSIKMNHNIGRLMCAAHSRRIKQIGTVGNPHTIPVCGYNDTVNATGSISMDAVGEIMPGYDKIMIRAEMNIPFYNFIVAVWQGPVIGNVLYTLASTFNVTFTLTNNETGVSAIIGRFFANESAYNTFTAFYGLPAHGTPAGYFTSIGGDPTIVTWIADIPITVLPTAANYADQCTIKCELAVAPTASNPIQTNQLSYMGLVGVRSFSIHQIKECL